MVVSQMDLPTLEAGLRGDVLLARPSRETAEALAVNAVEGVPRISMWTVLTVPFTRFSHRK